MKPRYFFSGMILVVMIVIGVVWVVREKRKAKLAGEIFDKLQNMSEKVIAQSSHSHQQMSREKQRWARWQAKKKKSEENEDPDALPVEEGSLTGRLAVVRKSAEYGDFLDGLELKFTHIGSGKIYSVTSDSDHRFTLEGPPGKYKLVIEDENFKRKVRIIELTGGKQRIGILALVPK